ncbi:MAG: DUF58 domain-containing protein [Planctomycetales bacterium]|nr:DUF58 domain-containing protein [Planctomycetales bacterium]
MPPFFRGRIVGAAAGALLRIPRPTLPGGIAVALAGGLALLAAQRESNLLLLLASLAAAVAFVGLAGPAVALAGLRVSRETPDRVVAGEPSPVRVLVHAPPWAFAPAALTVADAPLRGAGGGGVARVAGLVPGRAAGGSYLARFRRRGRYRLGAFRLETSSPFGFARARRAGTAPLDVLVLPAIRRIRLPDLPAPEPHPLARADPRPLFQGDEEEFRGLHDFRPGENPRRIHWRTSARVGRLLVREYEVLAERRVTLAVELAPPERAGRRRVALVERAVSRAASALAACEREGHSYRLALPPPSASLTRFGRGPAHLRALLERLAEVAGSPEGTAEALAGSLEIGVPRDAPVLWVRLRPGPPPEVPGGVAVLGAGGGQ